MALSRLERRVADETSRRAASSDRVAFATLVNVTPDAWQADVLRSTAQRLILNCSRQSGKSTVCALLALHTALYTPRQTILLISPSLRQSQELQRKVTQALGFLKVRPKLIGDSKTTIELENGSRIISLPATENTVRSFSANLIIEDEAGDVDDDLHAAILPMLIVSKGRLVLAGTPKGRRGHFFEHWERSSGYEHHRITWDQCPRIPAEEIATQRLILRERFSQEYECAFVQGGGGMVYGAFDEQRNVIDQLPRCERNQTWSYMLGMDFGFSDHTALVVVAYRQQDPCVYVVHSEKHTGKSPGQVGQQVAGLQGHVEFASMIGGRAAQLESRFRFSRIIGDTGGLGKAFAEELRRRFRLPIEAAEKTNKRGYIDLYNGDLATGAIKFLRNQNADYISELISLPWNHDRSKEDPAFDNHLCDAGLYVWRASTAYLTQKPTKAPEISVAERFRRETEEYWAAQEKASQHQEQPSDDWIFK